MAFNAHSFTKLCSSSNPTLKNISAIMLSSSIPGVRLFSSLTTSSHLSNLYSLPIPLGSSPFDLHQALSKIQIRTNVMRPRRLAHRKSQKGFFKVPTGGSLVGTVPFLGDYGLQATEGGRIEDKQLENARTAIRRVIRAEKGSEIFLRTFPDRPVTSKGSEARMGKGKGAVDFFAKWISEGAVIFEVKGVRKESAVEAMRVAGAVLPIRTRFVEAPADKKDRIPPRVLPFFIKKRLDEQESQEFKRDETSSS